MLWTDVPTPSRLLWRHYKVTFISLLIYPYIISYVLYVIMGLYWSPCLCSVVSHVGWFFCAGSCDIEYLSETHLKHGKFGPISFVHNIHFNRQIVSKFCTEHGNITVVLFLNFETIGQFMGRLVFARLEFKMRFGCRGGGGGGGGGVPTWPQPQSLGTVRCGHAPFIFFILLPIF